MSKHDFLERMRSTRVALNEAISGLSEEQIGQDLVTSEWTVKDILAHLAAWQNETLISVQRAERGETIGPMIAESVDEWNQRRVAERRRLPVMDVLQEFNAVHDDLLAALERWPEDGVPLGPAGWDETARLWWLTEHDGEHLDMIQGYRKRIGQV